MSNIALCCILAAISLSSSCTGTEPEGGNGEQPNKELSAPQGLALKEAGADFLEFSWEAAEGASEYSWRLLKGMRLQTEGKTSGTSAKVEGLSAETEYKFAVKSVSANVESTYCDYLTASTTKKQDDPGSDPDPGNDPEPTFSYEDLLIPSAEEDGLARAFPGAEGGARFATGGRGGKVYHVTNLNDSGTGSLRAAVEASGKRTVVFDVAGVIALSKQLVINNGDITIAGQTAPGDGICLKNYTFRINASNVIIRYIRCRMGDECKTEDDAMNLYTHSNNLKDVIIDHCSLSWCTDECGSFYGVTNFTLQWCILSESLRNSIHDKGAHGYGGIWGGSNATYHHNLLAHHDSRNPRFDHDYVSTLKGPVDYINNVVYNWGGNSSYGGESANTTNTFKQYNMVANYYRPGPATSSSKQWFIDPWTKACSNCTKETGCSTIVPGHFYLTGNVMHGNDAKTSDNWTATTADASTISTIKSGKAFVFAGTADALTMHDASRAFDKVTAYAGASLCRDSVDERVCKETKNGTYTYEGSNHGTTEKPISQSQWSTKGFIDTQSDVGGWPSYKASQEQLGAAKDSDGDGIPDAYEELFGLDKNKASDGAAISLDKNKRYTNLEIYLHYLVKDIVAAQNEGGAYTSIK